MQFYCDAGKTMEYRTGEFLLRDIGDGEFMFVGVDEYGEYWWM